MFGAALTPDGCSWPCDERMMKTAMFASFSSQMMNVSEHINFLLFLNLPPSLLSSLPTPFLPPSLLPSLLSFVFFRGYKVQ